MIIINKFKIYIYIYTTCSYVHRPYKIGKFGVALLQQQLTCVCVTVYYVLVSADTKISSSR